MASRKRREKPIRYRRLKFNASIASAQETLEQKLGLPRGSVKLVYPSGRKARRDSTVRNLYERWGEEG